MFRTVGSKEIVRSCIYAYIPMHFLPHARLSVDSFFSPLVYFELFWAGKVGVALCSFFHFWSSFHRFKIFFMREEYGTKWNEQFWGCNFDVFRFPQGPLLFDRSVSLRLTVVNAALCVYGRVCVMWPSSQHISQQLNASQHGIGDRGSSSWFFVNLFSISVYVNLNFSFRKRWSRSAMTRRSSQFFFSHFSFFDILRRISADSSLVLLNSAESSRYRIFEIISMHFRQIFTEYFPFL